MFQKSRLIIDNTITINTLSTLLRRFPAPVGGSVAGLVVVVVALPGGLVVVVVLPGGLVVVVVVKRASKALRLPITTLSWDRSYSRNDEDTFD